MDVEKVEETTEIKKAIKENDSKTDKDDKKSLKKSFMEFRGEFKKIIWPNREELLKNTITVVATSLGFGLLVFVMDTIFSFGYNTFIDLLTKI
jgi:preprotein translocase subunit SecE